jgi:hypothetical protein
MGAAEEAQIRGSLTDRARAAAALFCPRTLPGRLAAFGIAAYVLGLGLPSPWQALPWNASVILFVWALLRVPKGKRAKALGWTMAMMAVWAAINAAFYLVAWLADNGSGGAAIVYSARYYNAVDATQGLLVTLAMWFLLGVTRQAHAIGLDLDGKGGTQDLMVGLITAVCCILTAIFLLSMHFGGNQLRHVPFGQLVAATIFTVVVVAPYYKLLAQACWRKGVPGLLRINQKRWVSALADVRCAVSKADAERLAADDAMSPPSS